MDGTIAEENSATRDKGKRILKNVLVVVFIGLAMNVLLGAIVDYKDIVSTFATIGLWDVVAPFACGLVVYFIDSFRFQYLFRQFRVHLSFGDALYANLIGFFFSGITPSSAGGQPFQVFHFRKLGLDSTVSTNIVFSRLMVSSLAQVSIIAAVAAMGRGFSIFVTAGVGGFLLGFGLAVTLGAFALLFLVFAKPSLVGRLALRIDRSRLGRLIGKLAKHELWAEKFSAWTIDLGDSFKHLWARRFGVVLFDLCLHILDQAIWAYGLYVPFHALTGAEVPFLPFLFAFNLCGLVSAFIPTPGASGSIEASYAIVLGGLADVAGSALSAIIIWRLGAYYLHLLASGLVYAFVHPGKKVYEAGADGYTRRLRGSALKRASAARP